MTKLVPSLKRRRRNRSRCSGRSAREEPSSASGRDRRRALLGAVALTAAGTPRPRARRPVIAKSSIWAPVLKALAIGWTAESCQRGSASAFLPTGATRAVPVASPPFATASEPQRPRKPPRLRNPRRRRRSLRTSSGRRVQRRQKRRPRVASASRDLGVPGRTVVTGRTAVTTCALRSNTAARATFAPVERPNGCRCSLSVPIPVANAIPPSAAPKVQAQRPRRLDRREGRAVDRARQALASGRARDA